MLVGSEHRNTLGPLKASDALGVTKPSPAKSSEWMANPVVGSSGLGHSINNWQAMAAKIVGRYGGNHAEQVDGAIFREEWKRIAATISAIFLKVVRGNSGPPLKCENAKADGAQAPDALDMSEGDGQTTMENDPVLPDIASTGGGSSIGDSALNLERLFEHNADAELAPLEESLKEYILSDKQDGSDRPGPGTVAK